MKTKEIFKTFNSRMKEVELEATRTKGDLLRDIRFIKRYKKDGLLKHIFRNELVSEGTFMDRLLKKINIPRITTEILERDLNKQNAVATKRRGFLGGTKKEESLDATVRTSSGLQQLATVFDIAKPLLVSVGLGLLRKRALRGVTSLFFRRKKRKGLLSLFRR